MDEKNLRWNDIKSVGDLSDYITQLENQPLKSLEPETPVNETVQPEPSQIITRESEQRYGSDSNIRDIVATGTLLFASILLSAGFYFGQPRPELKPKKPEILTIASQSIDTVANMIEAKQPPAIIKSKTEIAIDSLRNKLTKPDPYAFDSPWAFDPLPLFVNDSSFVNQRERILFDKLANIFYSLNYSIEDRMDMIPLFLKLGRHESTPVGNYSAGPDSFAVSRSGGLNYYQIMPYVALSYWGEVFDEHLFRDKAGNPMRPSNKTLFAYADRLKNKLSDVTDSRKNTEYSILAAIALWEDNKTALKETFGNYLSGMKMGDDVIDMALLASHNLGIERTALALAKSYPLPAPDNPMDVLDYPVIGMEDFIASIKRTQGISKTKGEQVERFLTRILEDYPRFDKENLFTTHDADEIASFLPFGSPFAMNYK